MFTQKDGVILHLGSIGPDSIQETYPKNTNEEDNMAYSNMIRPLLIMTALAGTVATAGFAAAGQIHA